MNRKQKITLIIFLVIIICLIMIIRNNNIFVDLYEDILFLKNISNVQKQGDKQNKDDIVKYTFDIKCKNIDFKNVNLNETIKRETLINNKIAPGLEGQFDIVIKANQDTKYSIKFQSKTQKPSNLKFYESTSKKIVNTLEELQDFLTGNIKKDETKIIRISWNWDYENTQEGNRQDTIDSKNIDDYKFIISAIGEQINN